MFFSSDRGGDRNYQNRDNRENRGGARTDNPIRRNENKETKDKDVKDKEPKETSDIEAMPKYQAPAGPVSFFLNFMLNSLKINFCIKFNDIIRLVTF